MDDSVKQYEALEAFGEGDEALEVGQHVELSDAQAEPLLAEGKIKLFVPEGAEEEAAPEEEAEEEAA